MFKRDFETPLQPMALDEFMELARREVEPRDSTSLIGLMEPLYRLSRDKGLLSKFVNHDLATLHKGGILHFYSPQSCQLAVEDSLTVRINLWPLLPEDPRRRGILSKVLSYYDFHDHNFSFITANYFGPGYDTIMYRYDRNRIAGYPGEYVELEPLGRHTLGENTGMFYEECSDVHQQLPPSAPSASINLMLTSPQSSLVNQHYFDPATSTIVGYVESLSSKRVNGLTFAGLLGDDQTAKLLERIINTHPCIRTRVEAAWQLQKLDGAALGAEMQRQICTTDMGRALWDGCRVSRDTCEGYALQNQVVA